MVFTQPRPIADLPGGGPVFQILIPQADIQRCHALVLLGYPLVTFLQLLVDVIISTVPPMGYGHTYAPEHYIDAWLEVTKPQNWTNERINKLKSQFAR